MKKIFFLILWNLLLIFLSSCAEEKQKTNAKNIDQEIEVTKNNLNNFKDVEIATDTNALILGMTASNCVYDKAVGYGGQYTLEYACFERLNQLLDENEMYQLISDKRPLVRLYAFRALQINKSKYINHAKVKLEKDTAKVCLLQGCFQMLEPISKLISNVEI